MSYKNKHSFSVAKVAPGVIGEGRKITKTSELSSSISSAHGQSFTPDGYNNNRSDSFESAYNKQLNNPRFVQAVQMVASQRDPYETVPQTNVSAARNFVPMHHLGQQPFSHNTVDDIPHAHHQLQHRPSVNHPKAYLKQNHVLPAWSEPAIEECRSDEEDDEDTYPEPQTHPNKYPVQIECHKSKYCLYRRQQSRSGYKIKQINPPFGSGEAPQQIRYYQKDLVRICRCGNYPPMDAVLPHGLEQEDDGYEVHYSQKCKWKAYDDFKTGKRVLIRLCKCYRPVA